ncbi:sigma-70 family RNA polymerase sigma factor [Streptomyces albicerus]|uniref:sigma-70 family RNA polymerase sigma factor n=1 Tax=Streptomyces albicerus TaxID=2569859 RepID=UPI001CED2FC0|nr:sigma-70 family RNA polymerase sigma factor [Streptomyces albicerus]
MRRTTDPVPGMNTVGMTKHFNEALSDRCGEFIRELYAEHGTLLLRYAARLLGGDWHRAEDVLQEAAVRAWKHASALDMNVTEARPWLYTVVKNLVIDQHRARQIRPAEAMSFEFLDASVADGTDSLLTSHLVIEALGELSEQHREIIKLMYYLECSVAQVSAHLGIPPGTVKSRSYYALRALRKELACRGVTG